MHERGKEGSSNEQLNDDLYYYGAIRKHKNDKIRAVFWTLEKRSNNILFCFLVQI